MSLEEIEFYYIKSLDIEGSCRLLLQFFGKNILCHQRNDASILFFLKGLILFVIYNNVMNIMQCQCGNLVEDCLKIEWSNFGLHVIIWPEQQSYNLQLL